MAMQTTPAPLRPAQAEVHRTAHDQDLIEVPKRARLARETEGRDDNLTASPDNDGSLSVKQNQVQ
jgi:hypothetical protein